VALRVLAHFVPGDRVLDFVAPESDWLDVRWCAEDDDAGFYRELAEADVIWHVLRPLSATICGAVLGCGWCTNSGPG
jgi:hypothetical protein